MGPDRISYPKGNAVHRDIERILLSEEELRGGIERAALQITEAYGDCELVVVSILKGSCVFTADLIRRLPLSLSLAFVSVESYRESTVSGELVTHGVPPAGEIKGRRVLLLDDILDSGRTLAHVKQLLLDLGALDVASCVLLDKPSRRANAYQADYSLFQVDDVFVVGYGLDYAGRYRNLPYVGVLRAQALAAVDSKQSKDELA